MYVCTIAQVKDMTDALYNSNNEYNNYNINYNILLIIYYSHSTILFVHKPLIQRFLIK